MAHTCYYFYFLIGPDMYEYKGGSKEGCRHLECVAFPRCAQPSLHRDIKRNIKFDKWTPWKDDHWIMGNEYWAVAGIEEEKWE